MSNFKRLLSIILASCCFATALLGTVAAAGAVETNTESLVGIVARASEEGTDATENAEVSSVNGRVVSYVYYGAYGNAAIIGCMENGTKITVLKEMKSFYKIDCYDMNGYIPISQVELREDGEYYVNCDMTSNHTTVLEQYSAQESMELRSSVLEFAQKYLGVRYVYGGRSPYGFDCSGYTGYVFEKAGISLNCSALRQMENGIIISEDDLMPGDLVFYSGTAGRGFGSHVGIYIGNGKVAHASSSGNATKVVDFKDPYLYAYYQCSRRVILTDVVSAVTEATVATVVSGVGDGWRN